VEARPTRARARPAAEIREDGLARGVDLRRLRSRDPADRLRGRALLDRKCSVCRTAEPGAGFSLSGAEGDHVLRRVLAYRNYAGATESQLESATGAIEHAGSAHRLTRDLAGGRGGLGELHVPQALALEIALNEETERRLLEMELAELEARWRVEEEIAAIADDELTPLAGFASFRDAVLRRDRSR
jgi:hypothetical protein